MVKTIMKYVCESCLREINPNKGVLIRGKVSVISDKEHPTVIDSKNELVAYCNSCVGSIMLHEPSILTRVRREEGCK